ncbi:peptide ligase PGM1-related protein [Amycolatopsis sp. NPDC051045]|uniref:preATP grasp domain-containing protein n=1 Tax=Amycolatopsis sp. NPDC051045 TaxID=3156922 RepID=UPI00344683E8
MSTLIVSNQRSEDMMGDPESVSPRYSRYVGNQAVRMAWCLTPGDILVLPIAPCEPHLRYVLDFMEVDPATVHVVIPPPGRFGDGILSRDRLGHPEFLAQLRDLVATTRVDSVVPFHFDEAVIKLAHDLGIGAATPGIGFLTQGGGKLLNSKAAFRAIASGIEVPIPEGIVTEHRSDAEGYVWEMLCAGRAVIVKQDFQKDNEGHVILSPAVGVPPLGARRVEVLADRAAVSAHFGINWARYSDCGRQRVVIEHYLVESTSVYVELLVTDSGTRLVGHGQLRLEPVLNGLVIPAPTAALPAFAAFLAHAERLCEAVRGMGYRGTMSVDGVVAPSGDILVNEFNCRTNGSTHIHLIGEQVLGAGYLADRVIVELRQYSFASFEDALRSLIERGLAYDRTARRGVIISVHDNIPEGASGELLLVAEDGPAVEKLEAEVAELFGGHR